MGNLPSENLQKGDPELLWHHQKDQTALQQALLVLFLESMEISI